MEPRALLDFLVSLAEESGVTVRVASRAPELEGMRSGPCVLRGQPWLVLAPRDALEDQIDAAIRALRRFAADELEDRYLPPAVRERIEAQAEEEA